MFNFSTVASVIALVVAGFAVMLAGTNTSSPAVGADYDQTNFTNPIVVEQFTQGGGVLSISTTSATYTLTTAQMSDYNVIEINSIAAPALALTLPATSTMVKLLADSGDFREWFIDNQHAAATTTTITAGTGIDLIAVTANDDVIDGQEKSRLSCWRKANDDVTCIVSELLAAD